MSNDWVLGVILFRKIYNSTIIKSIIKYVPPIFCYEIAYMVDYDEGI